MKRICVAKLVYKKYKREKYKTKCVFVGGAGQNRFDFIYKRLAGGRGATQYPNIYNIFFM